MNGVTRRLMRKMRGATRRLKAPFRSYSSRKFMRGGQGGIGSTSPSVMPSPMGQPGPMRPMGQPGPMSPTGQPGPMSPMGQPGPMNPMGQPGPMNPMGQPGPMNPMGQPGTMSPMGQPGPYTTGGPAAPIGAPAAPIQPVYIIKVPAAKTNFDFSKARSNLPTWFGGLVPGGPDDSKFTINLSQKYTADNLPQFLVTGYVYSSTAGYIQVQRQFGVHAAVAAAGIAIDPTVKKITFTNITKVNFPYTANDSRGNALFIAFQILN